MKRGELLRKLVACRNLAEAKPLIEALEKDGCVWRRLGDQNNRGALHLTSSPGAALMERLTNASDAILEGQAELLRKKGEPIPCSPEELAEQWLGIPKGKSVLIPHKSIKQEIAKKHGPFCHIWDRSREKGTYVSTIEIADHGIGVRPEDFPKTIFSVHQDNKVNKPYLTGQFGMGGVAAYNHTNAGMGDTLVTSRKQPQLLETGQEDLVAVSYVRVVRGFALVLVGEDKSTLSIPAKEALFQNISENTKKDMVRHPQGTRFVMFNYDVEGVHGNMSRRTEKRIDNMVAEYSSDPILPYEVAQHKEFKEKGKKAVSGKKQGTAEKRYDRGARGRLRAKGALQWSKDDETLSWETPWGTTETVKVSAYLAYKDEGGRITKISAPAMRTGTTFTRVYWTLHGQTHAQTKDLSIHSKANISFLSDHLYLFVDMTSLSMEIKDRLITSTRVTLNDNAIYRALVEALVDWLKNQPELVEHNERLRTNAIRTSNKDVGLAITEDLCRRYRGASPGGVSTIDKGNGRQKKQGDTEEQAKIPLSEGLVLEYHSSVSLQMTPGKEHTVRLVTNLPEGYQVRPSQVHLMQSPVLLEKVIPSCGQFTVKDSILSIPVRCMESANIGEQMSLTLRFVNIPEQDAPPVEKTIKVVIVNPHKKPTVRKKGHNSRGRSQRLAGIDLEVVFSSSELPDSSEVYFLEEVSKKKIVLFVKDTNPILFMALQAGAGKAKAREETLERIRKSYCQHVAIFAMEAHADKHLPSEKTRQAVARQWKMMGA